MLRSQALWADVQVLLFRTMEPGIALAQRVAEWNTWHRPSSGGMLRDFPGVLVRAAANQELTKTYVVVANRAGSALAIGGPRRQPQEPCTSVLRQRARESCRRGG